MTIAALEAGCNVFVEKPAAATIQDIYRMREAEAQAGRRVIVGFQHISQPETAMLKKAVLAGEIGELQTVKCNVQWPRNRDYYQRNNWAGGVRNSNGEWILDSPFNNAVSHYLNLCFFFCGSSLRASCSIKTVRAQLFKANPDIDNADAAVIEAVTTAGPKVMFYSTHTVRELYGPEIVLVGSRGKIVWHGEQAEIITGSGTRILPLTGYADMRSNLRRAVIDAVNGLENDNALVCTLDIAAVHTLCVNGAHESSLPQEVPGEYIERIDYLGSPVTAVKDMAGTLSAAFDSGRLLTTGDYPWIQPVKTVDMTDYLSFPSADKDYCGRLLR
jgi:predicted dehydrogenase